MTSGDEEGELSVNDLDTSSQSLYSQLWEDLVCVEVPIPDKMCYLNELVNSSVKSIGLGGAPFESSVDTTEIVQVVAQL